MLHLRQSFDSPAVIRNETLGPLISPPSVERAPSLQSLSDNVLIDEKSAF
jgi:hypothetical protein